MGFRFRRSIKIAPGIKINIGKRGISSAGIGGFNFGSRGIYKNISIPGTGISYRSKILGQSKRVSTNSKSQQRRTIAVPFNFALQEDGTLIYLDKNGKPLSDNIIQAIKKQERDLILNWLQQRSEIYNSSRESLLKIHLNTPAPTGEVIVNPKTEPPQFKAHGLMSLLFTSQKQKTDVKNKQIQQDYEKELLKWEQAEQALRNNIEVMSAVISSAFASIEWHRETSVSFDIADNGNALLLDVDLPEIEDMPTQQAEVNRRDLKLTIKDLSQSQIQLDYLTHIHAIGFRLIGDVFAFLPSVSVVVFSGYSQRMDKKTGQVADEYLYSARVQRKIWEQINFKNLETIDVVACFEIFEIKRNITQRGIISPIEPFQIDDKENILAGDGYVQKSAEETNEQNSNIAFEAAKVQKDFQTRVEFDGANTNIREEQIMALIRIRDLHNNVAKAKSKENAWILPLLFGGCIGIFAFVIAAILLVFIVQMLSGSSEPTAIPGCSGFVILIITWIGTTYLLRRNAKQRSSILVTKEKDTLKVAVDEIAKSYPDWINKIGGTESLLDSQKVNTLLQNTDR